MLVPIPNALISPASAPMAHANLVWLGVNFAFAPGLSLVEKEHHSHRRLHLRLGFVEPAHLSGRHWSLSKGFPQSSLWLQDLSPPLFLAFSFEQLRLPSAWPPALLEARGHLHTLLVFLTRGLRVRRRRKDLSGCLRRPGRVLEHCSRRRKGLLFA